MLFFKVLRLILYLKNEKKISILFPKYFWELNSCISFFTIFEVLAVIELNNETLSGLDFHGGHVNTGP